MIKSFTDKVKHWTVVGGVVITLVLATVAMTRSIESIREPFPGFFYGPNLLVALGQRASWPGVQAGMESLDLVKSIDHKSVSTHQDIQSIMERKHLGDTLEVEVERNHHVKSFSYAITSFSFHDFVMVFLIPFLVGLLFIGFGAALYFYQPHQSASFLFFLLSFFIGIFCISLFEAYAHQSLFRLTLMYPIIGALSVHLFSVFPIPRKLTWRKKAIISSFYVFCFVIVMWRQIAMYEPTSSSILAKISSFFVLGVVLSDFFLLFQHYRKSQIEVHRDRLRMIGFGLLLAISFLGLWVFNFLLKDQSFYLDEGIFLAIIFPIVVAYAIVKRNLFQFDRVVLHTLTYIFTAVIFFSIFLLVAAGIQISVSDLFEKETNRWMAIPMIIGFFLVFNFLRSKVNQFIKRTFFRAHMNLEEVLIALDQCIQPDAQISVIQEKVSKLLKQKFLFEQVLVVYFDHQTVPHVFPETDDHASIQNSMELARSQGLFHAIEIHPEMIQPALFFQKSPELYSQSIQNWISHQMEYVFPLVRRKKMHGCIIFKHRRVQEPLSALEKERLQNAFEKISIIFENQNLMQEKSQKEKLAELGKMASVLIHDIKNPLSTIKISAGILKKRFDDTGSIELATMIESEVARMNGAVSEILSYAKPEGLLKTKTLIKPYFEQWLEKHSQLLRQESVAMEFAVENPEWFFFIDQAKMERVFDNLLRNAIDSMIDQSERKIFLRVHSDQPQYVSISVQDSGKGFDLKNSERIFQAFYTDKKHGTGLGLSIVKSIVEEHRGTVRAFSKKGEGAVFVIELPQE
ncbi:MAG: ATP-binding protein [Bdellovibrionota bacterium]